MTPRHRHLAELFSPLPLDSQPSGAVSQLPVESQPAWLDLSNRAFMTHLSLHSKSGPNRKEGSYHPSVIVCPSRGTLIVGKKTLNIQPLSRPVSIEGTCHGWHT